MLSLISFIVQLIPILISIAMLTLLERKLLGSMQRRLGPNTTGIYGILQPISDGLKLVIKEFIIPIESYRRIFILSAILSLIMSIIIFVVIPLSNQTFINQLNNNILLCVVISGISIYSILLSGWSGNSKYGLLGSIRSSSQLISYELSLSLNLILIILGNYFSFSEIISEQCYYWNFIIYLPICIIYFISILAETNRAPFDLPEAESELVSGFNTEFSSLPFALFFLAEYGFIISQSIIFIILFFGSYFVPFIVLPSFLNSFIIFIKVSVILYIFILIRGTLPRFRYDLLLDFAWNYILPFILIFLFLSIFILSV